MTKEQLDSLFKGISLLPKVQKRLERICEEPEGEAEANVKRSEQWITYMNRC